MYKRANLHIFIHAHTTMSEEDSNNTTSESRAECLMHNDEHTESDSLLKEGVEAEPHSPPLQRSTR